MLRGLVARVVFVGRRIVEIIIEGTPRPQGSKRHVGNGIMVESSKHVADWRNWVRLKASQAMKEQRCEVIQKPLPVFVTITFGFDRPKKHFRSNGELKPDAPVYHTGKPDVDKLLRAVLDAMTGIVFVDDSQVQCGRLSKVYCKAAETQIHIILGANV